MVKVLLFACFLMNCFVSLAQSASPNVLNTAGNTITVKNVQLSWSIGEIAISTLSTAGNIVTEGFLQPDMASNSAVQEIRIDNIISCFPNPVHNELFIRQSADVIGTVSVYNTLGDRVYEQKFSDGIIDMSLFRTGFYFINITNRDGGEVHTFKIVKY